MPFPQGGVVGFIPALFLALGSFLSVTPWARAGFYEREKPRWEGDLTFSAFGTQQRGFGPGSPSFTSLRLEGGVPGALSLDASFDGTLSADLSGRSGKASFDVLHGALVARRGPVKLSLGRLFMTAGLPLGYQDGAALEVKVLRNSGFRALGGWPLRRSGSLGRGRSWGGGIFHRGKAWGGALNADFGYHINSGQGRVWTGTEEELLPFIRSEVAGGVLSWSRHCFGLSSILNYDLLYRRWNEARLALQGRSRSGTTLRGEARLRGTALPGDSIFITFAGAGRNWWEGSGGVDLVLGRFLLRGDGGWSPELDRAWGEAGVQSRTRSVPGGRKGKAFSLAWGLAFKRETGPGSQAWRLKPRVDLSFLKDWYFSAYGAMGSRQLPGRTESGMFDRWAAGGFLSRRFGPGEARLMAEFQAWLAARPDHRVGLEYSLGLGEARESWRKP